jgi:protein O-mannosyl-transferase
MEKQTGMNGLKQVINRYKAILICLFLFISTFAVYAQVAGHEFLHFDDDHYIFGNPHVTSGLNAENIAWAFQPSKPVEKIYWHPLSMISHMIDAQFFGMNAGLHHLMNVFFHALNVLLLFLVLKKATGATWKSAIVASLFAFHPINVDTVAWAAERKNLLSTTFWMLTMYAYILYTDRCNFGRYILVAVAFILGLLAKPMLVTLPFVLLLMDFWPLKRIGFPMSEHQTEKIQINFPRAKGISAYVLVILEKLPLFACALVAIHISSLSIKSVGLIISTADVPMGLRISQAIVSYALYLGKMIWPVNLTFFYPYPGFVPAWQVSGSLLLIFAISILFLTFLKKAPYLIMGWLWFLGTLVPVSGIMQGGLWPAIAERWAYVPYIGLFIAITWYVADLVSNRATLKLAVLVTTAIVLSLFLVKISLQLPHWKNDVTFFEHGIEVDPANFISYDVLGNVYFYDGDYDKALSYFSKATSIRPQYVPSQIGMGNTLNKLGRNQEAETYYRIALRLSPQDNMIHERLASVLAAQMNFKDAIQEYKAALALNPDSADYNYSLANLLMNVGNADQAALYYRKVLALIPGNFQVRTKLAFAYASSNRLDDASREYSEVLKVQPDFQEARTGLMIVRQKKDIIEKKIEATQAALAKIPGDLHAVYTLAALNSSKGEYEKALVYLNRMTSAKPDDPDAYYNIACIKARQNKVDEALNSLQSSIGKGFSKWSVLKNDPDLENIRGTEFYKKLIQDHL